MSVADRWLPCVRPTLLAVLAPFVVPVTDPPNSLEPDAPGSNIEVFHQEKRTVGCSLRRDFCWAKRADSRTTALTLRFLPVSVPRPGTKDLRQPVSLTLTASEKLAVARLRLAPGLWDVETPASSPRRLSLKDGEDHALGIITLLGTCVFMADHSCELRASTVMRIVRVDGD